ncbi:MAG TPA: hypothetical protein VF125_01345 [Solirubrobacterales bacterium]
MPLSILDLAAVGREETVSESFAGRFKPSAQLAEPYVIAGVGVIAAERAPTS